MANIVLLIYIFRRSFHAPCSIRSEEIAHFKIAEHTEKEKVTKKLP